MNHGGGPTARHSVLDWFIHSEVAGSVVLLVCTVAPLLGANSPWADTHHHLAHIVIAVAVGGSIFALSLQHWVNDGLMVVFFFVVGLEIKRELRGGQPASGPRATPAGGGAARLSARARGGGGGRWAGWCCGRCSTPR